ncbi:MAG: DUF4115 domain-containing protein [Candidatus Omnitrophica bacterium]|nr:DUF4115 domain-containing protein [Candidatus Omnitrophota bacterium]
MSKTEHNIDIEESKSGEQQLPEENLEQQPAVTPVSEPPASSGMSVRKGLILKNRRIEQGLSLEAVHETTKIPLDALKAIEDDYTIGTLSPFYIRGFVKIYAKYLNIDVSEVLDDFQKEELPKVTKQEVDTDFEFKVKQTLKKYLTHQRRKQIMTVLGFLLFCFVLFHAITFMTKAFRNRKPKETVRVKPEPVPVAVSPAPVRNEPAAAPKPKVAPAPIPKPEVTPPKPQVTAPRPKPIVRPSPQAASAAAPAVVVSPPVETPQKDVRLTVRAQKDSWLRVKADDKTVFQSTLAKGAVETWQADSDIVIKGKNIIHLEFELNGKLIGTLGRKNRKAKSVTFTKDGLSVTK